MQSIAFTRIRVLRLVGRPVDDEDPCGPAGHVARGPEADPDTLVASAKAYLGALNKIVMKRQRDLPAQAAG